MSGAFSSVWRGERPFFEIWFVVVHGDDGRAVWLRYTTFSPREGDARATVWATFFERPDAPPRFVGKSICPIAEYDGETAGSIAIGGARLSMSNATGAVEVPEQRFAWDLAFEDAPPPAPRMPAVVERMPTPTKGHGLLFDAPVSGTITIDGETSALRGRALMMHLHGTRRVDALRWLAGPDFEVTSVRPVARLPALTTIVHEDVARTKLAQAAGNRVASPRTGLVIATARTPRTRLVARGYADPATFAGFAYRDPGDGHDVFVAQSDVATIAVERYARSSPLAPWRPVAEKTLEHAALEHHDRRPIDGVPTIGWDETCLPRAAIAAAEPRPRDHAPWPAIRSIVALGLTYRDHIAETGGDAKDASVVFAKHVHALLPEGDRVRIPSSRELVEALDAIEPGLARDVGTRYAFLPALMDYEVELGVVVLEDGDFGFFIANDLTARSCQILGEGTREPLRHWAVSKSFPGFCPVSPSVWRPGTKQIPEVEITTRVNGEVRQRASTKQLVVDIDQTRAMAEKLLDRPLVCGDAILTGTPSGVALQVPGWKRRIGDALFDRFGKLDRAISMAVNSGRFLGPGDVVEVSGGPLGRRAVMLVK